MPPRVIVLVVMLGAVLQPAAALTKTSSLPIWSTSLSGSTRIIFDVSRPK